MAAYQLNKSAALVADRIANQADDLRIGVSRIESGSRLIDCGIASPGGLKAGKQLAEVCLAGLGQVSIQSDHLAGGTATRVVTRTDHPVAACMASQYAGWQITGEKYFAMGSGPMRAAAGKEALFDDIGCREQPTEAVGVLETRQLPPDDICQSIAADCGVPPERLTLLVAPTASMAGAIQVVARTVETCLHKLHELGFDITQVENGIGSAPLPPVAPDDLTGIGWTNDAVLYGGSVTLWVRGSDDHLADIGQKVPSSASDDFGRPFLEIFKYYDNDFYKIDPLLFSPAQVTLVNLESGKVHRFGELREDILADSYLATG